MTASISKEAVVKVAEALRDEMASGRDTPETFPINQERFEIAYCSPLGLTEKAITALLESGEVVVANEAARTTPNLEAMREEIDGLKQSGTRSYNFDVGYKTAIDHALFIISKHMGGV